MPSIVRPCLTVCSSRPKLQFCAALANDFVGIGRDLAKWCCTMGNKFVERFTVDLLTRRFVHVSGVANTARGCSSCRSGVCRLMVSIHKLLFDTGCRSYTNAHADQLLDKKVDARSLTHAHT